ncbi:MAG TPA: tRNA(His) guanylyltransferase Thg1 family protein, partial [Methanosarcina sp.]|nr:tRNA(His) guanylyltransferase Thg1 family protein [Methanosarcina sp.]
MAKTEDLLGDKVKGWESLSTGRRAFQGQPIIVRLDGKAFHTFTKGLEKPYDQGLTDLMIETMSHLV